MIFWPQQRYDKCVFPILCKLFESWLVGLGNGRWPSCQEGGESYKGTWTTVFVYCRQWGDGLLACRVLQRIAGDTTHLYCEQPYNLPLRALNICPIWNGATFYQLQSWHIKLSSNKWFAGSNKRKPPKMFFPTLSYTMTVLSITWSKQRTTF